MLSINRELAERIERGEAAKSALIAEQLNRDFGEPTVIHHVGSAVALNMGSLLYHPASRVLGLGFGESDLKQDLDEVEAFYRSYQLPVQIDYCPFADGQLGQELRERGYRPYHYVGVFAADLREVHEHVGDLIANRPDAIEVHAVSSEMIPTLAQVAADGFGYPPGANLFQSYVRIPNAHGYAAYVQGEAAACGAFSIHASGMASLYLGAARPEYRGLGCQLTLTAVRLQAAVEMGCELAVVHASPGSISHRNMERAGFRMAYTKMILTKDLSE